MRAIKLNFAYRLIRARHCRTQVSRSRSHSQDSAAGSVVRAIASAGARMKYFHAFDLVGFLNARNLLSHFNRAGISTRRHHHARRRILRPAKITVTYAAFNRSLDRLHQIAFRAHEDRLGLGIAESAVEFEHLRPARSHHQSAIEYALVLHSFCLHASDGRPRHVLQQPIRHLLVEQAGKRIRTHTAGVRARVALADTLVVLCGHKWSNALSVAE